MYAIEAEPFRNGPVPRRQFRQNLSVASFQHGVLEPRLIWMSVKRPLYGRPRRADTQVRPPGRVLASLDAGYPCPHDDMRFYVLTVNVSYESLFNKS